MYWHFILNPGLAINELILGQRMPQQTYLCTSCALPIIERGYVHCPGCGVFHSNRIWSARNAFGNWLGLICPSCGGQIPCLWNLTSRLLLTLTAPIWWLPLKHYKAQWLEQQYKRTRQTKNHYMDEEANKPKSINYMQVGLAWGAIMFIATTILFPTISMLAKGHFSWSDSIREITSLGCVGFVIWLIGGLSFGVYMQLFINRMGGQPRK